MKNYYLIICFLFLQNISLQAQADANQRSGYYFSWGWNRGWYSDSDMEFIGDNYHFTLYDVYAKDRQSEVKLKTYLGKPTIPQYNFRVGYYFKNKLDLSFGIDHMKYVVQNDQTVKISGYIEDSATPYNAVYDNEDIFLSTSLVRLEHTDGLNYLHFSLRRTDKLFQYKKIGVSAIEGISIGGMFPRTDSRILLQERRDDFHLSGAGANLMLGLQLGFGNNFFVQAELKGGYINMPDVKTAIRITDRAKQDFFFTQFNVVLGANILGKYKN